MLMMYPLKSFSYDPYDKVTITSPVFVKPVNEDIITVAAKMGDLDRDVKIQGKYRDSRRVT